MKIKFSKNIQSSNNVDGMKVMYPPTKRLLSRWRWYLIILLAVSPLLLILNRVLLNSFFVQTSGTIYLKKINIVAPITGNLMALYTRTGDIVHKDAPLILVGDPKLVEKRLLVQREIESTELFRDDHLEKMLSMAQTNEKKLANDVDKLRRLMRYGAATTSEIAAAEVRHDSVLRDLIRAREDSYVRRSQSLRQLKELEIIEDMEKKLSISSPVNGQVLMVNAMPETSFIQGTTLLTIADFDDISILAYVQEKDVARIVLRGTAVVQFPSEDSFTCHVSIWPQNAEYPALRNDINRPLIPLKLIPTKEIAKKFFIDGLPCSVYFGVRAPGENFMW